jgi:hypothetical protein
MGFADVEYSIRGITFKQNPQFVARKQNPLRKRRRRI